MNPRQQQASKCAESANKKGVRTKTVPVSSPTILHDLGTLRNDPIFLAFLVPSKCFAIIMLYWFYSTPAVWLENQSRELVHSGTASVMDIAQCRGCRKYTLVKRWVEGKRMSKGKQSAAGLQTAVLQWEVASVVYVDALFCTGMN